MPLKTASGWSTGWSVIRLLTALACVTTYMLVTGVVYNTLLRGIELPQGTTVPWSNEVLHVIGPVFLLLDLIFGSSPARLQWRSVLGTLVVEPDHRRGLVVPVSVPRPTCGQRLRRSRPVRGSYANRQDR